MAASYEDKERGLCHCERFEEDQFDVVKENLLENVAVTVYCTAQDLFVKV